MIEYLLHLDEQLFSLVSNYGLWIYIILFAIIFLETGAVIAPFLPGDSLLFAAGAISAAGSLNIIVLLFILVIAAILGDTINYALGYFFGPRVFKKETGLFFNKKHLITTENFYKKHGAKTIILARFLPIVRTFAPFVAGVGKMNYSKFLAYNVSGGILWVFLFTIGGYLFGNIPIVKNNFELVIIAIIIASIAPLLIKAIKSYLDKKK